MKFRLWIAAAVALLSGCTSMGQLDGSTAAPGAAESVFVLGLAPADHRIFVFPGRIEDGRFHQSSARVAALYGGAKDGYVLGKASAGDVLAITNVRVVSSSGAVLGADFKPCGEAKTIVFEVPAGGVIYLGDLAYAFRDKQLSVRYGQDFAAASQHIDANYPALKGRLRQASYQPVYLPR